jgi:hypothetical protein
VEKVGLEKKGKVGGIVEVWRNEELRKKLDSVEGILVVTCGSIEVILARTVCNSSGEFEIRLCRELSISLVVSFFFF